MADACLRSAGIECSAEAVGRHYGPRSEGGLLDAWLVDSADADAVVPGVRVVALPLLMPNPAEAAALAAATLEVAGAVG
jgi:LPPG:FO 2-phospho-L-lactate transferase